MTAAVEKVLPQTLHLFCIRHIFKNIAKNCAGVFKDRTTLDELMGAFKKAAFSVTQEVFVRLELST